MTERDDPNWLWEFRAENFVHARLAEDLAAARALPDGPERENSIIRVESLRLAVIEHSPYVDKDGQSWGRCITCPGHCGFPCSTMRYFTRMWRHHPDYLPSWNDTLDGPDGPSHHQTGQLRLADLGGYRKAWFADHPEAQP